MTHKDFSQVIQAAHKLLYVKIVSTIKAPPALDRAIKNAVMAMEQLDTAYKFTSTAPHLVEQFNEVLDLFEEFSKNGQNENNH